MKGFIKFSMAMMVLFFAFTQLQAQSSCQPADCKKMAEKTAMADAKVKAENANFSWSSILPASNVATADCKPSSLCCSLCPLGCCKGSAAKSTALVSTVANPGKEAPACNTKPEAKSEAKLALLEKN